MITFQSYISTLMMVSMTMGIVFEIPILPWFFAKLGFIFATFMHHYRKHAVVIILIVAVVITLTSDVFALSLAALPMWILYEGEYLGSKHNCNKIVIANLNKYIDRNNDIWRFL